MQKGRIVILSGPSGSGKTTLYERLLKSPEKGLCLVKSVSATTRPPRPGEKNGRDYFFISEKMFLYKRRAGHFLESEKVFCYYYGTPNKNVQALLRAGKNVLLCIDVKGAKQVWRKYPNTVKIFVKTPSLGVLGKRLAARKTESPGDLKDRLETARNELKAAKNYDHVIVNDRIEQAHDKLVQILKAKLR